MPTEIDYARLAAYIDGEGSITIGGRKRNKHGVVLRVTNTDPRLLLWCRQNFGGYISIFRKRRRPVHNIGSNVKACGYWGTGRRPASEILRRCLPYLIIKHEQAEVAIALQESVNPNHRKNTYRLTPLEIKWRNEMGDRVKALNRAEYSLESLAPTSLVVVAK